MLFLEFSQILSELEQTSSRLEMTAILVKLFQTTTPSEVCQAIYLLQGSVGPQYEHIEFGLAERLVFKAVVSSFSLNSQKAKDRFHDLGDLGRMVEYYRQTNVSLFQSDIQLSLGEVFAKLQTLATLSGSGSQDKKLGILSDLLQQLDPLSCRYLVRMVVGAMRLGFSDMTVLDALSWYVRGDKSLRPEIERAFNVRPDLGLIAQMIKENQLEKIRAIEPAPGVPILMARAERVTSAAEIIEKIGKAAIEPKYDGFRLQLHKIKDKPCRIYSRNLDHVEQMFPDLVEGINEVKGSDFIIEGEAVGFNPETRQILPFQEIVQRKRKYSITEKAKEIPLKLFAFEVLYVDGESYIGRSYQDRRAKLRSMLSPGNQTILLSEEKVVESAAEISEIFEKAVGEGLEGIMAKKISGVYRAGARDWNWIKLKHTYSSKLMDTLDCLVLGYDYGKGKRSNFGIGAFLVGVYDPESNQFLTVAKIGTGLTDDEWRELKKQTEVLETKTKPDLYNTDKLMTCDVWIKPKIVVEIRADEVSISPSHTARYALRFPRLEKFREDKSPEMATTLNELIHIYKKQFKSSLNK